MGVREGGKGLGLGLLFPYQQLDRRQADGPGCSRSRADCRAGSGQGCS